MSEAADEAMRTAVSLAGTGQFSNWWSIAARLRIRGCRDDAVRWSACQREWLDRLCAEARRPPTDGHRRGIAAQLIEFPTRRVGRATAQALA